MKRPDSGALLKEILNEVRERIYILDTRGNVLYSSFVEEPKNEQKIWDELHERFGLDLDPSALLELFQRTLSEGVEKKGKYPDQEKERIWDLRFSPIASDGRNDRLLLVMDEKDPSSEEKGGARFLSKALEQSQDHIMITDKEGRIEYVNPAFEELSGYSWEEAIGKTPRILKSGEYSKEFYRKMWKQILRGESFRFTFKNAKKNGELFYEAKTITPIFDQEERLTHFLSTAKDVTKEEELKRSLSQQSQLFQELTENINEIFFIRDLRKNEMIYVSPSYETLFGRPLQKLYENPQDFLNAVVPEHREEVEKGLKEQSRENLFQKEYKIRREDGEERWVRARTYPIDDHRGEMTRLTGVIEDITDKKELEMELLQEAEFIKEVLSLIDALVMVLDPKQRIEYVNRAFEEITGYSEGEVLGKDPRTLMKNIGQEKDLKKEIRTNWGEGRTGPCETILLTKNGGERKLACSASTLRKKMSGEQTLIVSGIDITEQRKAEERLIKDNKELEEKVEERTDELGKTNEKLRAEVEYRKRINEELISINNELKGIYEGLMDGVLIVRQDDHRIVKVNQMTCRILGYEREELLSFSLKDLFPYEEDKIQEVFFGGERSGKTGEKNISAHRKDGALIYVDLLVNFIEYAGSYCMIGFLRDVTARVKTQKALQRSEAKLTEAQRIASIGNWEWDIRSGRIEWSEQVYRIFGYEPNSFSVDLDKFMEHIHPEDREKVKNAIEEAYESGEYSVDHQILLPSGEVKVVHENGKVSFDENGEPKRFAGTVQDITERKRIEEKLKQSLEEKDLLFQELHHRVKNNLQIVSGLLMLQSKKKGDEALSRELLESRNRVKSIALIHEKLYKSQDLSEVDFSAYLKEFSKKLLQAFKAGHVELVHDLESVKLNIDRIVPLGLITNEVLTNSIDHGLQDREKGWIRMELKREGDRLIYRISDNGSGIPMDEEEEKPAEPGIGWRLIQNLTQQLKGELELRSEEGTEIRISMPLEQDPGDPKTSSRKSENKVEGE